MSDELQASYSVEAAGGDSALVLRHPRHGAIRLTRAYRDDFAGSTWFVRSVEFQRDAAGRVTGFVLDVNDRSRAIRFARRPT